MDPDDILWLNFCQRRQFAIQAALQTNPGAPLPEILQAAADIIAFIEGDIPADAAEEHVTH